MYLSYLVLLVAMPSVGLDFCNFIRYSILITTGIRRLDDLNQGWHAHPAKMKLISIKSSRL